MGQKIAIAATSDIPVLSVKCFEIAGTKIAVFHQSDGFFAIDDACPHQGGPLSEGFTSQGRVECPWHQWEFCLQNGLCETVPSAAVNRYPVEVKDDKIWLTV